MEKIEEMAKAMRDWALEEGEDFNDYFTGTSILGYEKNWAEFLTNKGHVEFAQNIIKELDESKYGVDLDDLFDIKPTWGVIEDWDECEKNVEFNNKLLAEFILENEDILAEYEIFMNNNTVWNWSDENNDYILVIHNR